MFLRLLTLTCVLCLGFAQAVAQTEDKIDWNKAQRLHQKFLRSEKLTDEEQAYHDRAAKALRAKAEAERRPPPAKPPVGLKPLSDMTGEDHYKGQDGDVRRIREEVQGVRASCRDVHGRRAATRVLQPLALAGADYPTHGRVLGVAGLPQGQARDQSA